MLPRIANLPPDGNLRLAVIQSLLDDGVIPGAFDRARFLAEHGIAAQEETDDDDDPEWRFVHEIHREIQGWLTVEHLPRVQRLYWAGGQDVQHWIWEQWDGESDEFDVRDLTGIQACTALTTICFDACFAATDLSALAELPHLRELTLAGVEVPDLGPLARAPRLRTLSLQYFHLRDASALAGHPTLESVDVSRTSVRDVSFAGEMRSLRTLAAPKGAEGAGALVARGVKVETRG